MGRRYGRARKKKPIHFRRGIEGAIRLGQTDPRISFGILDRLDSLIERFGAAQCEKLDPAELFGDYQQIEAQTFSLPDENDEDGDEWTGGLEQGETFVLPGNGMFPDLII